MSLYSLGLCEALWNLSRGKETHEEGVTSVSQKSPGLKSWVVRLEHKMSILWEQTQQESWGKMFKMRMLLCSYYKMKHLDIATPFRVTEDSNKKKKKT